MIVEWAMGVFSQFINWFFLFLPPVDELESAPAAIQAAMAPVDAALTGLGGWVPWGTIQAMLLVTFGFWGVAFGVRIIKSFLPAMNG